MDKEDKKHIKIMIGIGLFIIVYAIIVGNHPEWTKPNHQITKDIKCDSDTFIVDSAYSDTLYENSNDDNHTRGHNSMDADDEEYWNSVNREKALRDAGEERAADIEHNSRIEYLQGGGYHSQDGSSQVQFQGSKEQKEQLEQMDKMGW